MFLSLVLSSVLAMKLVILKQAATVTRQEKVHSQEVGVSRVVRFR